MSVLGKPHMDIPADCELQFMNRATLRALSCKYGIHGNDCATLRARLAQYRDGDCQQNGTRRCRGCTRIHPVFPDKTSKSCCKCLEKGRRHDNRRGQTQERIEYKHNRWCADFQGKLRDVKHHANQRNIPFQLSDEQAVALFTGQCVYCGHCATDTHVIGIDRVDNNGIYVLSNCVPCCKTCNRMKRCEHVRVFLSRAIHIDAIQRGDLEGLDVSAWPEVMGSSNYCQVRARCAKLGRPFELTREQFDDIRNQCCIACLHPPPSTVDRRDNYTSYDVEHAQPMCYACNMCKSDSLDKDFFAHCARISRFQDQPGSFQLYRPLGNPTSACALHHDA